MSGGLGARGSEGAKRLTLGGSSGLDHDGYTTRFGSPARIYKSQRLAPELPPRDGSTYGGAQRGA